MTLLRLSSQSTRNWVAHITKLYFLALLEKSEVKVSVGLVSPEASLSTWLVDGQLLPVSSHGLLSVCVCLLRRSYWVRAILMTSF